MNTGKRWGGILLTLSLTVVALTVLLWSAGAQAATPAQTTTVQIHKRAAVLTATWDQIIDYTLVYTIPSGSSLNQAQLRDCLPDNSPASEPYFNFLISSVSGPNPGNPFTPAAPAVIPTAQAGNCWLWDLGNLTNSSGNPYVYIITYQASVRANGSVRGEVGTNTATFSWNEGDYSVNDTASVTILTPNIANSARIAGPGGQIATAPGSPNFIQNLRAGDIITLTLNFENTAGAQVSTAYSTVIYSLIPNWIGNLTPIGSTPMPDITLSGGDYVVRWHAPGTFTGPGETAVLATLAPGATREFVLRGQVIANVAPGRAQWLRGFGTGTLTSRYKPLPNLPGVTGGYNFLQRDVELRSARIALRKTAVDPTIVTPAGYLETNEVVTYTVIYTIPHGTTLGSPAYFEDRLGNGLHFGGIISQPASSILTMTSGATTGYTWLRWAFADVLTATTDIVHTYVFTAYMDSRYFLSPSPTPIPRGQTVNNEGYIMHPANTSGAWNTTLDGTGWRVGINYARPYFDDLQKCLWRGGACSTGTLNIEGGETLVFRIRNTRNGGIGYTGANIAATTHAHNVVITDTLPPGAVFVSAWPGDYVTSTVGSETRVVWTFPTVEKGYYIPGVNPPTPSITESYFVITATAPLTIVGNVLLKNNVDIRYEDVTGAWFTRHHDVSLRVLISSQKTATTPRPDTGVWVGDVITYTITDVIPKGGIIYWPQHRDVMPLGLHYISPTLVITNATLIYPEDPLVEAAGGNEQLRWRMATRSYITPTHTFQTRYTGLNMVNNPVYFTFTDMRNRIGLRNIAHLDWNTEDISGTYPSSINTFVDVRLDQPNLGDPLSTQNFAKTVLATESGTNYVEPGQLITYSLRIRNIGYAPAFGAVLSDTLPAGVTFITYTATLRDQQSNPYPTNFIQAPTNGAVGNLTWELDAIPPRTTAWNNTYTELTLNYTVQVNNDTLPGTVLQNAARIINYASQPSPHPYARYYGSLYTDIVRYAEPLTVTPPLVHIGLHKIGPAQVAAGETFTYTLTYTKTGSGSQAGLLTDTLPSELLYVGYRSIPPVSLLTGAPTLVWDLGALAHGTNGHIVITVTTPSTLPNNTLLTNHAELSVTNAAPAYAQAETQIVSPQLYLIKDVSRLVVPPGELLIYTLYYGNVGGLTATNVYLGELYDPQVTFVAASPPADIGNNTWDLGDLSSGVNGSVIITVSVSPDANAGDWVVNQATLTASNTAPVSATATTLVASSFLEITKHAPAHVNAGERLTYTLHYTASGEFPAENTVLTESYPPQVMFVSATPMPTSGNHTWALGTLPPTTTGTIEIVVHVASPLANGFSLVNTAQIVADNAPPQTANVTTTVHSAPVLHLTKQANVVRLEPGDTFVYHIGYHNTGTTTATNIIITETYDPNTVFVQAMPAPTIGNHIWELGALPVGSRTIAITVSVPVSVPDGTYLLNQVTLTANETAPLTATHSIRVGGYYLYLPLVLKNWQALPDLTVTDITISPPAPGTGETTIISVTITNQGSAPAANFWVDLYIDPTQIPTAGDTWNMLCATGKAWFVRETLLPGQSLILNTEQPDDPLNPEDRYSNWPGYFESAGTHLLYAQVDSYPAPSGLAAETLENNNVYGPVTVNVATRLFQRLPAAPIILKPHR